MYLLKISCTYIKNDSKQIHNNAQIVFVQKICVGKFMLLTQIAIYMLPIEITTLNWS